MNGVAILSPDGEIGRRSGLKIRRPQGRGGSSPPPGTKSTEDKHFITKALQENLSFYVQRRFCVCIGTIQSSGTRISLRSLCLNLPDYGQMPNHIGLSDAHRPNRSRSTRLFSGCEGKHQDARNGRPFTMPTPSRMVTNWPAASAGYFSTSPRGQWISMSAVVAEPRPKCRRGSLAER